MDKKLTDNEIIKALECCTTNGASCKDCPAFVRVDRSNCKKYFRGALDLINRQKAEIERLKLELADTKRDLQVVLDNSISAKLPHCVLCGKGAILTKSLKEYDELIADISAEAYKECIEKVREGKEILLFGDSGNHYRITDRQLDNLLKEMVGDK